ncbi:MAG: hypothetical protein OJF51_003791 [Nitrospira sp.]|nr:MAG: hypothetical protein OJF51_003791 [Nitrospira sp.]
MRCQGKRWPHSLRFRRRLRIISPFVRKHLFGAWLICLDVSTKSLTIGKCRFRGEAQFVQFDGANIPFPGASFGIVFAACVFHHINH